MRTIRLTAVAALIAAGAAVLAGCGGSQPAADGPATVVSPTPTSDSAAISLDHPFAKPDLRLTDQDGKPFDLTARTAGRPTLLYFGYTHCPDVCPTTMADIADARAKLPAAQRAKLAVVFVSTDPQRDTPARLKSWLGAMDPSFIGLTGNFTAVQQAARSLGVLVDKPVKEKDGSISVQHGAEVFAFSPKDGKAHYIYTSGVTVRQWEHDLPSVVKGVMP